MLSTVEIATICVITKEAENRDMMELYLRIAAIEGLYRQ